MPNTSVHFPGTVLEELDNLAKKIGVSRNRLIVQSCQKVLGEKNTWPADLFDTSRYSSEELELLRSSTEHLDTEILAARWSRKKPPF